MKRYMTFILDVILIVRLQVDQFCHYSNFFQHTFELLGIDPDTNRKKGNRKLPRDKVKDAHKWGEWVILPGANHFW